VKNSAGESPPNVKARNFFTIETSSAIEAWVRMNSMQLLPLLGYFILDVGREPKLCMENYYDNHPS
jgi:hypothetical protein